MNKMMKTLALGALMCGAMATSWAAELTTPAGTMTTPNDVKAVSVSASQTLALLKADSKKMADPKFAQVVNAIGQKGDVYQLQGTDNTTHKTAFVVVYNAKDEVEKGIQSIGKEVTGMDANPQAQLLGDLGAAILSRQFHDQNGGIVIPDSLLEPVIEGANHALTEMEPMLNKSMAQEAAKGGPDMKVKLEDMELIHKLEGTQYPTYTAGTRALLDVDGFQMPYYVKAYAVMNPQAPTAIAVLTSDVERGYFAPMLDQAVKTIK